MLKDITSSILKSQTEFDLKFQPLSRMAASLLATAILFLAACEDIGEFDQDVLPPEDIIGIEYTDTTTIVFQTEIVDSLDSYRSSRQLFGNYIDPQFGTITAATYTEILPRDELDFGSADELVYDSLVLRLSIESSYGSPETPQVLRVYPLTDTFPDESLLSTQVELAFDATRDLTNGFEIQLGSSGAGNLSVRMDDELGRRILFASADTLGDRDLFKSILSGLYIGTDPVDFFTREPGAIYTLFGSADGTQLELYYKKFDSTLNAFVRFAEPFVIRGSTPRYHSLKRTDVAGTLLEESVQNPDTENLLEFNQGAALVKNIIKFPTLTNLGQVGVSRAELVLHVDQQYLGSEGRFAPAPNLLFIEADEDGNEVVSEDGLQILATLNPANYDKDEGTYSLLLTSYIQDILLGSQDNNGLIIVPDGGSFRINRVVFGGTEHPDLAPELRITYSTLPR